MANWNPNSNKHKAVHRGYKSRPTKKAVEALMGMYAAAAEFTRIMTVKPEPGKQLKLDL